MSDKRKHRKVNTVKHKHLNNNTLVAIYRHTALARCIICNMEFLRKQLPKG